jgi:hypothetical protein
VTTASLEVGSTVGDYKILAVLGRGGMGRVLQHHDASPELTDRFIREMTRSVTLTIAEFSIAT